MTTHFSDDARDFLDTYKRKVSGDPRLEKHQDIITDFGESYERAYSLWNTFYAEAYKDLSYFLGNQWSLEEISYLNNQRRSSFTYNKIRRVVKLIEGYQRKNRLSTIISPIEDSSELTANILTDCVQYVMQSDFGYETISEAFKGELITGISFVSPWIDYRSDPVSGDIRLQHDAWNSVIMSPFFTKKDLTDCPFIARRKFLSRTDVISLHPDKEDMIQALPYGSVDDKFTYLPYERQQWGLQKLLSYTEYWRNKWTIKKVMVDKRSGEVAPWMGNVGRFRLMQKAFPDMQNLELISKPVQSVEKAVIVEGQLLSYEENPDGLNEYPFVPFMCTWEPSYDLFQWKLQSIVRPIRDPQTELNKRRSKMVDILDNQMNSGWIAKNEAVTNPSSLYKTGQSQVIWMKNTSNLQADIVRLNPPDIPASMFQLEAGFDKDIMEIPGVNSELFGMSENEKVETAGILAKMRQSAGLVNLQDIFDGLRESQRLLGQKVMKLIQINYTPEKVKLITKKDPTPEFFSGMFAKYNVLVEEGVLTDSQRETQFLQMAALKMMGVQFTDDEIVMASNLHDKTKYQQRIQAQNQGAQQQQQQQAQLAMEQQATITRSLDAKSESDRSLAAERLNKVGLDAALNQERIARAEEDRTSGVLNLIKAAKELEGMDVSRLKEMIDILQSLEGSQKQK